MARKNTANDNTDNSNNNSTIQNGRSTEVFGSPNSSVGMKDDKNQLLPNTRINNETPRTTSSKHATSAYFQEQDKRQSISDYFSRNLAVFKADGRRSSLPSQDHRRTPTGTPKLSASWMTLTSAPLALPSSAGLNSKFSNESSEKNQLEISTPSIGLAIRTDVNNLSGGLFFKEDDGRRPSVASTKTSSSQSSKSSLNPAAINKKLQAFFGEGFTGKERSDNSINLHGKDVLSHTIMRNQAHRTTSPITETIRDTTRQREASPTNRRPITPVPSRDVVPFLYQDSQASDSLFLFF
ncbi:hypothetical protein EPUL_000683 [Erysiphe pulchra]|uniref:Uncharacterized protein n=1 Tax=Erysiphe pulchra TaxID=225359 RepID=A0A2S4Q0K4_9PEZI|nr:hypothetical protein EPUL_000683 [Erysiphe pulchra]